MYYWPGNGGGVKPKFEPEIDVVHRFPIWGEWKSPLLHRGSDCCLPSDEYVTKSPEDGRSNRTREDTRTHSQQGCEVTEAKFTSVVIVITWPRRTRYIKSHCLVVKYTNFTSQPGGDGPAPTHGQPGAHQIILLKLLVNVAKDIGKSPLTDEYFSTKLGI